MSGPQTEQDELDAQLAADWEDVGGVGKGLSPEQLEHIAVTMFGCTESNE